MLNNLRRNLIFIALPALLLASALAIARTVTTDTAQEVARVPPAAPAQVAQRGNSPGGLLPGLFVPSDKISADKPVSFPSDI